MSPSQLYCMIHLISVALVYVTFMHFVVLAPFELLGLLLLSFCTDAIKLTAAPKPSYTQVSSVVLGPLEGIQ